MVGFRSRFKLFNSDNRTKPPEEFLCPILGTLMFDPVVVSSGQTFERNSAEACRDLNFTPSLDFKDSSPIDFSNLIPNINLKSSIRSWCAKSGRQPPVEPCYSAIVDVIKSRQGATAGPPLQEQHSSGDPGIRLNITHPIIRVSEWERDFVMAENIRQPNNLNSGSSDESVVIDGSSSSTSTSLTVLPLATLPASYSYSFPSGASSDIQDSESRTTHPSVSSTSSSSSSEDEKLCIMFTSPHVHEQEKGVMLLRQLTRSDEASRASLCTPALLECLKTLIVSQYVAVQINALAGLVNLSLENSNRVALVRAGVLPLLISILKCGSVEAQEHSAGALFSLALLDENRLAIGANGALQPLMHALLTTENERTRHDSALALYNLSLVKFNQVKLVNMGAVTTLMTMAKNGRSVGKVLLVLNNLVACNEGKDALINSNEVSTLVNLLRRGVSLPDSDQAMENCVSTLFALSQRGNRFMMQALEAGAVDVLREIEERGSARAREKAKRMRTMLVVGNGSLNGSSQEGNLEYRAVSRGRYSCVEGPNSSKF